MWQSLASVDDMGANSLSSLMVRSKRWPRFSSCMNLPRVLDLKAADRTSILPNCLSFHVRDKNLRFIQLRNLRMSSSHDVCHDHPPVFKNSIKSCRTPYSSVNAGNGQVNSFLFPSLLISH